jgi:hypothetical protein
MDKWEFFQDAGGLWRWRCTPADGHIVLNSPRSHPSRAAAVADAAARGYGAGAVEVEVDLEETSVSLRALRVEE